MDVEILGPSCDLFKYILKDILGDSCSLGRINLIQLIDFILHFREGVKFIIDHLLILLLVFFHVGVSFLLYLFCCQYILVYHSLCILLIGCTLILYDIVHFGLSEERLILFIVPVSSVADDIDEDVFLELESVSHGDLHASVEDGWLISIYVEDGSSNNFGNFCAVIA